MYGHGMAWHGMDRVDTTKTYIDVAKAPATRITACGHDLYGILIANQPCSSFWNSVLL
jgi:hypothetical protein